MANYITTLKDDTSINTLSPRTVLKAIADDNGAYLSSQLTAASLNSLANGDANNIRSSSAISVYSTSSVYRVGDKVLYSGVLYRCIVAGATGTWDSSKWSEISLAANSDAISNISAHFFKTTSDRNVAIANAKFLILLTADFKDSDGYNISITLPVSVLALTNTTRYYQAACTNTGGMCQLEWNVTKTNSVSPNVFRNGTVITSSTTFTYTYV